MGIPMFGPTGNTWIPCILPLHSSPPMDCWPGRATLARAVAVRLLGSSHQRVWVVCLPLRGLTANPDPSLREVGTSKPLNATAVQYNAVWSRQEMPAQTTSGTWSGRPPAEGYAVAGKPATARLLPAVPGRRGPRGDSRLRPLPCWARAPEVCQMSLEDRTIWSTGEVGQVSIRHRQSHAGDLTAPTPWDQTGPLGGSEPWSGQAEVACGNPDQRTRPVLQTSGRPGNPI